MDTFDEWNNAHQAEDEERDGRLEVTTLERDDLRRQLDEATQQNAALQQQITDLTSTGDG